MSITPKTIRTGTFKKCSVCGTSYYVRKYLILTSKYCSVICKLKGNTTKIIANCIHCGNEFTHIYCRQDKAKYCSNACYIKEKNKISSGIGTVILKCHHCEKKFKTSPSRAKLRKFCSRQCTNKESKKTFKPKYSTVRKAMLRRGLINKCERCNYDKEPKILGVHHKDRNRHNNLLSNLETLCPNCHSLEHLKFVNHG